MIVTQTSSQKVSANYKGALDIPITIPEGYTMKAVFFPYMEGANYQVDMTSAVITTNNVKLYVHETGGTSHSCNIRLTVFLVKE